LLLLLILSRLLARSLRPDRSHRTRRHQHERCNN
jgi:hypothetical protein